MTSDHVDILGTRFGINAHDTWVEPELFASSSEVIADAMLASPKGREALFGDGPVCECDRRPVSKLVPGDRIIVPASAHSTPSEPLEAVVTRSEVSGWWAGRSLGDWWRISYAGPGEWFECAATHTVRVLP